MPEHKIYFQVAFIQSERNIPRPVQENSGRASACDHFCDHPTPLTTAQSGMIMISAFLLEAVLPRIAEYSDHPSDGGGDDDDCGVIGIHL
jgi:hypothetical protein